MKINDIKYEQKFLITLDVAQIAEVYFMSMALAFIKVIQLFFSNVAPCFNYDILFVILF